MDFNGVSSYIDAGNSNSVNLNNNASLSILVWINLKSRPENGYYSRIISKFTTDKKGYELILAPPDASTRQNKIYFQLGNGNLYGANANALSVNEWRHFAGTFNGTNELIYENGVLITSSRAYTGDSSSQNLTIGKKSNSTAYWNGSIDELMIFNRSLNAAEIIKIYNYNF
jgi:hypothetical protein